MITIEENARQYFRRLIDQQDMDSPGLRMSVEHGGTPAADCQLTFCEAGDQAPGDEALEFEGFTFFVESGSIEYLDEAVIDFREEGLGGELTIKAPNLKGREPGSDAPLEDRVAWLLDAEINPMVAQHGGSVALVEVNDSNEAVLQFGGGCHGCGMVDVTLKQGIESTLRERIPELAGVRDATDHSTGTNPYY